MKVDNRQMSMIKVNETFDRNDKNNNSYLMNIS